MEGEKPSEEYHAYISHPFPLSEEIVDLTGITDEMLIDAPQIDEALKDFVAFSEGCILVGYNLPFICKFLDYYGDRCNVAFSKDMVDVLPLAKRILGKNVGNYRLGTIAEYYNISEKPETTMQDTKVTARIMFMLAYLQKSRFNRVELYQITATRRKIRNEI